MDQELESKPLIHWPNEKELLEIMREALYRFQLRDLSIRFGHYSNSSNWDVYVNGWLCRPHEPIFKYMLQKLGRFPFHKLPLGKWVSVEAPSTAHERLIWAAKYSERS